MSYQRYSIPVRPAPNIAPHPSRFRVKIRRGKLALLLLRELLHYRGDLSVVLSRPCVYGVFSGALGGFRPRESRCVGCLRCTVQHPDIVQIHRNPDRLALGDSYAGPDQVDTLLYEASTGRVPVRGAGYGGMFGGQGWDGMWTDMSEIVRPTRDGIHGREYISTEVFLGSKPVMLEFDPQGRSVGQVPRGITLPIPMLLDAPPPNVQVAHVLGALVTAAEQLQTLIVLPWQTMQTHRLASHSIAPLVEPGAIGEILQSSPAPRLVELDGWEPSAYAALASNWPDAITAVRLPLGQDPLSLLEHGVPVLHLTADYHGRSMDGSFVLDAIRQVHAGLVERGRREQVTVIGSGGILAAEHVPKAILSGLDAVGLDLAPLIAMQGQLLGEARMPDQSRLRMPDFEPAWGAQRVVNLAGSWRDQLLEVLGAMGLREVRRLRGELGRAMFQVDLEREAFADIPGYGGSDG